jgi:hypothetical protein
MPFFLQRKKGAGLGRVFAFASIANQPHTLENVYVPGSGVGASTIANRRALSRRAAYNRKPVISSGLIYSKNNVTDGGFTVGNPVEGMINEEEVFKDMRNRNYTNEFDPNEYPQFFPDMAPFIDENILAGDKIEDDRLIASQWRDLGDDVFDDWGFFYLYDVNSGKYYFPILDSQNNDDGIFATQIFYVFGRIFTVIHGWSVQGIFKIDISVADSLPFRFGGYGNMGSDGNYNTSDLTQNYTVGGRNLTMYYHRDKENGDDIEQLYTYWIPKKVSENSAQTYYNVYGINPEGDDEEFMSMLSKTVTSGLIVYFAKSNDVKDWVINDLAI